MNSIPYIILSVLIAILFFFLSRRFIKKSTGIYRYRTLFSIGGAVFLTFAYLFTLASFFTDNKTKKFDSGQWFSEGKERYIMADDLVKSKILIGKDTTEITRLLGEPTGKIESVNQWYYNMGAAPGGFGIMFHHLVLQFDQDRVQVVKHAKIQD